jgi:hypothetical protein
MQHTSGGAVEAQSHGTRTFRRLRFTYCAWGVHDGEWLSREGVDPRPPLAKHVTGVIEP